MSDKEAARDRLARAHYSFEPGITEIFAVRAAPRREASPAEPIKLLEVNRNTIPSGIVPLGFDPAPARGVPFPSVIIEVTPAEMALIRAKKLRLPNGWTLGPPVPRPDDAGGGTD